MFEHRSLIIAASAVVAAIALAGCATNAAISDISDSKVQVQSNKVVADEVVDAEAQRGCDQYGKTAVPLSVRCGMMSQGYCVAYEHLYACSDA